MQSASKMLHPSWNNSCMSDTPSAVGVLYICKELSAASFQRTWFTWISVRSLWQSGQSFHLWWGLMEPFPCGLHNWYLLLLVLSNTQLQFQHSVPHFQGSQKPAAKRCGETFSVNRSFCYGLWSASNSKHRVNPGTYNLRVPVSILL